MLSDTETRRQQWEQKTLVAERALAQRDNGSRAELDQLRLQLAAALARAAELEEERRRLELESRERENANEKELTYANSSYSMTMMSNAGGTSKQRMVSRNH